MPKKKCRIPGLGKWMPPDKLYSFSHTHTEPASFLLSILLLFVCKWKNVWWLKLFRPAATTFSSLLLYLSFLAENMEGGGVVGEKKLIIGFKIGKMTMIAGGWRLGSGKRGNNEKYLQNTPQRCLSTACLATLITSFFSLMKVVSFCPRLRFEICLSHFRKSITFPKSTTLYTVQYLLSTPR